MPSSTDVAAAAATIAAITVPAIAMLLCHTTTPATPSAHRAAIATAMD